MRLRQASVKYFKTAVFLLLFILISSFVKDALAVPTASTSAVTGVNATYATLNGSLDDLGGETINQHGFVWSTTDSDPVIGASAAPLSQWKLNDNAANTTVVDSVGSNNGTAGQNTSVLTTTGKLNSALAFNGSSDYISLPSTISSSTVDNITVAAWVYSNTLGQASDYRAIVSEAYNGDGNVEFELYLNGANHNLSVGFYDGSWHTLSETTAFPLTQWVFVAASYDGHYLRIFRDGTEVAISSDLNLSLPSGTNGWRIGRRHDTGNAGNLWNGNLDEVRIYNTTLTPADIKFLYNEGDGTETVATGSNTFSRLGSKGSAGSFSSQLNGLLPNTGPIYVKVYVEGSTSGLVYGSAQNFTTTNSGFVTWDGSSSTAWALTDNWVEGIVPTSTVEVVINGSYTNAPTLDLSGGSTTVEAISLGASTSSTLTISNSDMSTKKLIVTADVGIGGFGTLTHTANTTTQTHVINLEAANLTISTGGKIDLNSKGFQQSEGPGQSADATGAGGASYGGQGGNGVSSAAGSIYGSLTEPINLGSGGGRYDPYSGGPGGGAVKLSISSTTAVSGNITARGGNADTCSGGGSGGGIWLDTGNLVGIGGTISTNGGTIGGNCGGAVGGGGGGRIAVYYTTDNSTTVYQSHGGAGNSFGGFGAAGTIYRKADADTYGDLTIDNYDQDPSAEQYIGKTSIGEASTFDTITISNYGYLDIKATTSISYTTLDWSNQGVIVDNGGTFALVSSGGSSTIPAGATLLGNVSRTFTGLTVSGTLTHSNNTSTQQYTLNYIINGDLTINSGGAINVDFKGFKGTYGPGAGGSGGSGKGGGGGYGGSGGQGSVYAGGSSYGSVTEPTDIGSGGGQMNSDYPAGAGGGAVKLIVSGTTNLTGAGAISANGQNYQHANNAPGGGAGGSIWLNTGTLSGSGSLTANGGIGNSGGGGGAGGGRIAIYYTTDSSSLTYQAYGGAGYSFGGAGTIYKKPSGQTYGNLIIDNNDQNSYDDWKNGKTPIEGAINFDTITISNYGYLDIKATTSISYTTLDWSNQGVIVDNGGTFALMSDGGSSTIPAGATLLGNVSRTFTGLTVSGTLSHSNNTSTQQYTLNYTINGDLTVSSGGYINVDYKGYAATKGPGAGGTGGSGNGGGGGYGGSGGRGSVYARGSSYGSVTEPTDLGSGGGQMNSDYPAGAGGGAVKLIVSGTTNLTGAGAISANGQNYQIGSNSPGGGSGGSIWLNTGTLSGSGSLTANGGIGNGGGGGAGGGRIAIYYETKTANLTVSVNGGIGYRYGQAGTIVYNGEYIAVVDVGNGAGTDHTSLAAWQTVNQTDLTATTTKVFNHSGITGSISDAATVTGATSSNKATVIHATPSQILLSNIRKPLSGTLTFTNGTTTVSGASTAFTTQLAEGEFIWLDADNLWVQVSTTTSNTALTLTANYAGTGGAGAGSVKKYSFTLGEQIYQTQNVNYVVAADSGCQPIAVAKLRTTTGAADTAAFTLDGWTTSANNYIKIWTDPAESYRHQDGRWSDSKYRLEVADASALIIKEEYVKVEGLQIKLSAASTDNTYGVQISPDSATNEITVAESIIKGAITGTSAGNSGIAATATGSNTLIYNNLFYDFVNGANNISTVKYAVAGNHYLYNNTAVYCYNCYVQTAGTVSAKNNIAQIATDGFSGTFDGFSDYNISDLAADASGEHSKNSTVVNFINAGSRDFRLAATDRAARDAGVSLVADSYLPFSTDLDGDTRPAGPAWDIGADEESITVPDYRMNGWMKIKGFFNFK